VTKDDTEIVSALRNALAGKVGQQRFDLWFGTGTRFELQAGTLVVNSPNRFFRDWLVSNFRRDLEAACLEVLGECPTLDFCVDASLPQPHHSPAPPLPSATPHPSISSGTTRTTPSSAGQPQRREAAPQAANGSTRRRCVDFGSFIVGTSNRLAQAAAEMVVERPGEMSPLVLHGPTGVGKTHLLEAVCHVLRKKRPGATAIYLTAEQFTSGFLQALRGSGLPSFRQKYRSVELLAVDDLQFFCGKNARYTQLELLYTIDSFLRDRRQIVFAADRSPAELSELGQDMRTRLEGGMVCRIEAPDYKTRLGILAQMAGRFDVRLPDDVQTLVASRLTSHARELSGAICRLRATSQALGRPIGLEMAEEALADMLRPVGRLVRLPDIAKAVSDTFGLDPRSLQSGRKAKSVSYPRMLAMWLARKHTRAALSEIGEYFGRRSHSTVISAQKRVETWLAGSVHVELLDSVCSIDQAIRCVEQRLMAG
jgi:chromosomal replication initiator protein